MKGWHSSSLLPDTIPDTDTRHVPDDSRDRADENAADEVNNGEEPRAIQRLAEVTRQTHFAAPDLPCIIAAWPR
eukprot:675741-Rhodomonas_salina.1